MEEMTVIWKYAAKLTPNMLFDDKKAKQGGFWTLLTTLSRLPVQTLC